MLKNLIIVLIIVIILAIGLNFDELFFQKEETIKETLKKVDIPIESIERNATPKIELKATIQENNNTIKKKSHLSYEINKLLKEANLLFRNSKDIEALELYREIVQKTKKSQDPQILEQFAEACIQMAFLYQIYPNSDKDASIEAYELVINKFKNSQNPKLLNLYISATIQQSYLFDNSERVEVYDELIKKFENSENSELQKKVEELLINKSFELMGKNDEEAMEILDKLINKYENKKENEKLPQEIELAILNNLELSIITSNDDEKYVELANKYLSESPDTKPVLDMLEIIKNAQYLDQDDAFNAWKEEHKTYHFDDWSFQEIRRWINKMEDKETQERVTKYIDAFENQKYNQQQKENNSLYQTAPKTYNNETSTYQPYDYEADEYSEDLY